MGQVGITDITVILSPCNHKVNNTDVINNTNT